MVTKKDYEVLADMLGFVQFCQESFGKGLENDGVKAAINGYMTTLNPRFNKDIFWEKVTKEKLLNEHVTI